MSYRETLRWRAFDTHGVITIADAERLGVPAVELRKLAHRGALERLGHGIYRMSEVPPTPLSEYAEAVALAGPHAVIADDAVLALQDLALVNPRHITVATPDRIRATLPPTVRLVRRQLDPDEVTDLDGVPAMTIPAAIRACRGHVMTERLTQAVHDARERRLIDHDAAARLLAELSADQGDPGNRDEQGHRGSQGRPQDRKKNGGVLAGTPATTSAPVTAGTTTRPPTATSTEVSL
ncbi:type IV toxin-antitoxin system AbiEi family antitoxin domain-containing protein [Kineococcus aurantiacus]|uniref:type IV toxin-antitoxin system AbiEi family antitoxin domain-containing protein n=1 Tax=Kineococcus aurantiacus TaxID=37633 RepID=UPI0031CEAAD3